MHTHAPKRKIIEKVYVGKNKKNKKREENAHT